MGGVEFHDATKFRHSVWPLPGISVGFNSMMQINPTHLVLLYRLNNFIDFIDLTTL